MALTALLTETPFVIRYTGRARGVAIMLDALWADVRLAVRALRQSPGFSGSVVLTFALAIGASTTVFSLFNAVVLLPIPVDRPDGLTSIAITDSRTHQPILISVETLAAFRAGQRSFSSLALYWPTFLRVEGRGASADVTVEGVEPAYFDLVGVRAPVGRLLTDADRDDGAPAVVLSERFWRRFSVATHTPLAKPSGSTDKPR